MLARSKGMSSTGNQTRQRFMREGDYKLLSAYLRHLEQHVQAVIRNH